MKKGIIKKLLNSRVGTILLLEAFLILLKRVLETSYRVERRTAIVEIISSVNAELESAKAGEPFTPIFK